MEYRFSKNIDSQRLTMQTMQFEYDKERLRRDKEKIMGLVGPS